MVASKICVVKIEVIGVRSPDAKNIYLLALIDQVAYQEGAEFPSEYAIVVLLVVLSTSSALRSL